MISLRNKLKNRLISVDVSNNGSSQKKTPNHFDLPEEIDDEIENSFKTDLKNKLKKFAQESAKLEKRKWMQSWTVNKVYLPEKEEVPSEYSTETNARLAKRRADTHAPPSQFFSGYIRHQDDHWDDKEVNIY